MSDLPGEITKQSLVAPARIIRSTRYSLTARGRSTWPSRRLPTGSSSFENASGWILLPTPAAGMMPHIRRVQRLGFRVQDAESSPIRRGFDSAFGILRPAFRAAYWLIGDPLS